MLSSNVVTQVILHADAVEVSLRDPRAETLETFEPLSAYQQGQLAEDAWHVGLRALTNAYRQAQEARLADIGASLREDLDEQLIAHAEQQERALQKALARYFDPQSGELEVRLRQFIGDEGALVHLLQRHLGPQNSVLVETLANHVGERSALFRKLSPTDSEGLVQVLGERLRQVLQAEHSAFQKALDPVHKEGAVGRFITQLRNELKRAEDDQAKQLKIALAALDTTREDSLLNQMRRETRDARNQLLQAINPAAPDSPLAIIKNTLTELLAQHAKSQKEQIEAARKENAELQRELRDAVQRIETRRREERQSSRGGGVFEDAVVQLVQRLVGGHGYVVDATGSSVGSRPACKVGDAVIQLPSDHAFAGSSVVIEAKRDRSYSVSRALEELAVARENRGASAGIFVLARSHAAPGFQSFARYGQDVVVVWDDEDPSTDAYLQAAVMVGLALVTRSKAQADAGDLQALQGVQQRLVKELERLDKIRKAAEAIRRQVETIEKEVAGGQKKVTKLVADAKKTLTALHVELRDEQEERESPIAVNVPAENDVVLATAE